MLIMCVQESDEGLFIDLNSWLAFSKDFAKTNFERTGHGLYLNIKRRIKVRPYAKLHAATLP